MRNNEMMEIQKKIIPEVLDLMDLRYNLLLIIKANQPIGRRNLANTLGIGERQVRNEIEFFHKQNFITVERQGISLSDKGENILNQLKEVIYNYKNLDGLVEKVKHKLNIDKVFIVPGDCTKNKMVLEFMGEILGKYIMGIVKPESVIGLTGGSSVAAVASNMPEINLPKVTVLPARGGIGKSHSIQANSIVSTLAKKLHAQKEMLHLPDFIQKELLDALKEYPDIKEVFDKYQLIDIMIFGIGRADTMAKWRNLSKDKIESIKEANAVAEAFGFFFNDQGQMVSPSSSVGISLEDYKKIPHIIAIAGGKNKAEAILATSRIRNDLVLVTDESASIEILKI
ncbi:MAG: sugar-binding transcriptional regulator [Eubacteriales bacterium]